MAKKPHIHYLTSLLHPWMCIPVCKYWEVYALYTWLSRNPHITGSYYGYLITAFEGKWKDPTISKLACPSSGQTNITAMFFPSPNQPTKHILGRWFVPTNPIFFHKFTHIFGEKSPGKIEVFAHFPIHWTIGPPRRRLLHGPRRAQLREPLVVRPLEAVPGVHQDVKSAQGGPWLLGSRGSCLAGRG